MNSFIVSGGATMTWLSKIVASSPRQLCTVSPIALASITKLLYRFLETRYWALVHGVASKEKIEAMKASYYARPMYIKFFYWVNKNLFSSTGVFLTIFILSLVNRIDVYIWFYALGYTALFLALFTKQLRYISTHTIEGAGGGGTPLSAAE